MTTEAGFDSDPHHFNTYAMTESRLALIVVGKNPSKPLAKQSLLMLLPL